MTLETISFFPFIVSRNRSVDSRNERVLNEHERHRRVMQLTRAALRRAQVPSCGRRSQVEIARRTCRAARKKRNDETGNRERLIRAQPLAVTRKGKNTKTKTKTKTNSPPRVKLNSNAITLVATPRRKETAMLCFPFLPDIYREIHGNLSARVSKGAATRWKEAKNNRARVSTSTLRRDNRQAEVAQRNFNE